jgi:hypothetical protein
MLQQERLAQSRLRHEETRRARDPANHRGSRAVRLSETRLASRPPQALSEPHPQVDSSELLPLRISTKVRVRRDPDYGPGPWPDEPTGTLRAFPVDGAPFHVVNTTHGVELLYWIVFDDPQVDAEGDGPYTSSEVLGRYVERLSEEVSSDEETE